MIALTSSPSRDAVEAEVYPWASRLCLFGVLLHIMLSPALLQSLGISYSAEGGSLTEKLHPGTFFILPSFAILLLSTGNPIAQLGRLTAQYTTYMCFLLLCLLLLLYMTLSSGAMGLGFYIDGHICPVLCAIVLSYVPLRLCRRAVYFFVGFAVVNSLVGIAEAVGRFHILQVEKMEDLFRATALMGHPLENAMFTSLALFVTMALPFSAKAKGLMTAVFILSLVAFGGRAALLFSLAGVCAFGLFRIARVTRTRELSLIRIFMLLAGLIVIPAVCAAGLYFVLNSSMGERLTSNLDFSDSSAGARAVALQVFHYMTREELLFGVSTARIEDITYRMDLVVPLPAIENPWILMCMHMGLILFPVWLAGTVIFAGRLIKGVAPALKVAVIGYFIIASTSNSFGSKDSTYVIMVSAIICASRYLQANAQGKYPV